MNADIEQYLNDELTPAERARFEGRMAEDPALRQEVERGRFLLERLRAQMLREKITAALAGDEEEGTPGKNPGKSWIWLILILMLAAVAGAWYFWPLAEEAKPLTPTELPQEQATPELPFPSEEETEVAPEPEKSTTAPSPIAEAPRQERPSTLPGTGTSVRGGAEEEEDLSSLLASVWHTRFDAGPGRYSERFLIVAGLLQDEKYTDAYARLQLLERRLPQNDTLAFLKGFCLLEMREGAGALGYFQQLPPDNPWQEEVQWYTVLALLLNGEQEQALMQARPIASLEGHPFREQAAVVLEQLE